MLPTLKTENRLVSWGTAKDVIVVSEGSYSNLSALDRATTAPPDSPRSSIRARVEEAAAALGITDLEEIKRLRQDVIDGKREITW